MEFEQGMVAEVRADRGVLVDAGGNKVTFFFDRRRAMDGISAPTVFLNERKPVRDGDVKVGGTVVFSRRSTERSFAARWETLDGFDEARRRIAARALKAKQLPLPTAP